MASFPSTLSLHSLLLAYRTSEAQANVAKHNKRYQSSPAVQVLSQMAAEMRKMKTLIDLSVCKCIHPNWKLFDSKTHI